MKSKELIHPEDKVELIKNTKKPIFVLGIVVWVALFAFMFGASFFKFKTGNAISLATTGGVQNSIVLTLLLVCLSVLLYFIWVFLIKKKRRK